MILHDNETIRRYTDLGLWGQATFNDLFQVNVEKSPGDLAIIDPPNRADFAYGSPQALTYAELEDCVTLFASRLLDSGLGKDSVVFTQLPNIVESIIVCLAAVRIGSIICPAQMAYGEADLARKVQHVRPRCIVALLEFKDRHPVNEFQRIADLMPADTPAILALGDSDGAVPMFERPTDAQRLQVARHCAATTVDPNEVIGLIWTSGTTGFPKCAPRTHNNAIAYAGAVVEASFLKNRERTRILVPLSLAHTAGLGCYIPAWLMTGGLMVLHQPFNLDIYLDQLEEHRINATVAAPVMLNMILKENKLRGRDLSSLGAIMSGSAPLDAWVIDRFKREHGVTIVNSFGSTEGIAMATGPWMSDRLEEQATLYPRCVGSRLRPSAILENVDADMASDEQSWPFALAPGVEHKLVDIDTKEEIVEEHRPGELALKAPTVFAGYLTADFGLDRDDFDEDGFFRTGEIFEIVSGVKGPDFIHYIDRLKDVINRGGVKIPAGELNAVVNEHPALVEAAVIGAPDSHLGEQICVVAVLKEGESITLEHLNDFIRDAGVAKFMWPERLVLTDSLPRNPTGKVLKQKLRQLCNANAPVTCA